MKFRRTASANKILKNIRIWFLVISCTIVSTAARAQQTSAVTNAPIPAAIYSARKIFISNAGADSGLFPHPFSGTSDRAYNQLYDALQSLAQFTLVSDPAEADMVLQLQLVAPGGPKDADKTKGSSDPLPMFRLSIFDRPTHYILWTLTESIEGANLQKTHDRNFDDALNDLVNDFKKLTSKTSSATP